MIAAARAAALACLLAAPAIAVLAAADGPAVPRDPDFGVVARGAIGLERNVEMYQWHRDGEGYRKAWSDTHVDSRGFVPGHENPPEIPLRPFRWKPARVLLDGKPVTPAAVEALAEWRVLRPDFSALPGNLSATFQPEGDGLGSAANPSHPRIGDLRVTWRERRMPDTYEGLVLRDGVWELDRAALARGATQDPRQAAGGGASPAGTARAGFAWILLGALAAAVVAGAWMLRRRRRRG